MKTAIVGHGFVGKAMHQLFPKAVIYDLPYHESYKEEINTCDVAFVCVPTPMKDDGSCDISIVEEVVAWLETPLVIIRSTVPPGTTARLQDRYDHQDIVFQPEYVGETVAHPLLNEQQRDFIILGGDRLSCEKAVELYQSVYNASVKIMILTSTQAEIVKYMENTAIAAMVTLVNEYYNICGAFEVDYTMVREAFLLDPRMSRYFTFVYPDRGFGGKCLPKDLNAIIQCCKAQGYEANFIKSILQCNDKFRSV